MNYTSQGERKRWNVVAPTAGVTGGLTAALVSRLKWPHTPTHPFFASAESQLDTRYAENIKLEEETKALRIVPCLSYIYIYI